MDTNLFIIFIIVSIGLIIIPGPNVLVIVSTSIVHGKINGLRTVAGTSCAMAVQLILVGVSTSWLVQQLVAGFYILKWLGVAYLVYLGLAHLKQIMDNPTAKEIPSSFNLFSRGFFISLANPKTLLFFSAFLPQFISPEMGYVQQISILSLTFLSIAILLDTTYALLAAKIGARLKLSRLSKIQNGISGLILIAASIWLAAARPSQ